MDIHKEIENSFQAMQQAMLQIEINEAKEIREEAHILFNDFEHNKDIETVTENHAKLLIKLIDFEENLINVEILNFLYSTIARVALNSLDFKTAIQYAQAGIEVNQKSDDDEGVRVNRVVLLDTACFINAFKSALKLLNKYPDIISDPMVSEIIKNTPSKNDDTFDKLLTSKKRPKTLKYCLDDKLKMEEKAIKSIMRQMGVTRNTALKYAKQAKQINNS